MNGVQYLACLWVLCVTQTGLGHEVQFLERHEGESVVLSCVVDVGNPPPLGVYLNRLWLHPGQVLFKYTESDFSLSNDEDTNRTSVNGDPNTHAVNVTISQLRVSDTDRYHCEFIVGNPSGEDIHRPGKMEFVLLVNGDASGSLDIGLVQACAGGSATLPCLTRNREGSAVEGVILKRRKNQAPWEVLYHSKHHHSGGAPPSSAPQLPAERVHLSSALGPAGVTHNLTLQQLQPEDSGLYSCQLLLLGKSHSIHVGGKVFLLSVQDQCGCTRYSTLLYALFAAVAVLLILLGCVLVYQRKAHRRPKSHTQAPIYEEMSGVRITSRKPTPLHPGEVEPSENRNRPAMKSCPENHYETPRGGVALLKENEKSELLPSTVN